MRKTMEVLGLMLLGYLAWITYSALNGPSRLPERIPTHFDISGKPNAWGSPGFLWILPVVGLGLYVLMTALASIQFRRYNLPVRVTEVNTLNRPGKKRRTKYGFGKRPDTKRAIVTVAPGERIDIFSSPGS